MLWCIGIQVSRHLWAEVGFSPQCAPGTGSRQGLLSTADHVGLQCVYRESKQRADFVTISHWLLIWSGR